MMVDLKPGERLDNLDIHEYKIIQEDRKSVV